MKLTAHQTTQASRATCFQALTDFDAIFQSYQLDLTRLDAPAPPGPNSRWDGSLDLKGIQKRFTLAVDTLSPDDRIVLVGQIDKVDARCAIDLAALDSETTEVTASLELKATSLSGKLLLKSLSLVRAHAEDRLRSRLAKLLQSCSQTPSRE